MLAFAKTRTICSAVFILAGGAGNALLIGRVQTRLRRDGATAGPASRKIAGHQTVSDRHPLVENKTLPLPE
jgi:hypothetical protein